MLTSGEGEMDADRLFEYELPPGWTEHASRSTGKTFYRHKAAGICQWRHPGREKSALDRAMAARAREACTGEAASLFSGHASSEQHLPPASEELRGEETPGSSGSSARASGSQAERSLGTEVQTHPAPGHLGGRGGSGSPGSSPRHRSSDWPGRDWEGGAERSPAAEWQPPRVAGLRHVRGGSGGPGSSPGPRSSHGPSRDLEGGAERSPIARSSPSRDSEGEAEASPAVEGQPPSAAGHLGSRSGWGSSSSSLGRSSGFQSEEASFLRKSRAAASRAAAGEGMVPLSEKHIEDIFRMAATVSTPRLMERASAEGRKSAMRRLAASRGVNLEGGPLGCETEAVIVEEMRRSLVRTYAPERAKQRWEETEEEYLARLQAWMGRRRSSPKRLARAMVALEQSGELDKGHGDDGLMLIHLRDKQKSADKQAEDIQDDPVAQALAAWNESLEELGEELDATVLAPKIIAEEMGRALSQIFSR